MPTHEEIRQARAEDRAERAAAAHTAAHPAAAHAADPPAHLTQDQLTAAADAHRDAEIDHQIHEQRMAVIKSPAGAPRAFPTPDWHPLDVKQPQTLRPVEPTPHSVPFDAQAAGRRHVLRDPPPGPASGDGN